MVGSIVYSFVYVLSWILRVNVMQVLAYLFVPSLVPKLEALCQTGWDREGSLGHWAQVQRSRAGRQKDEV